MLTRLLTHFVRCGRGNVAAIFGLALLPTIGLVGAAVDYSLASDQKTRLQASIDGAVLAGVSASASTRDSVAGSTFATLYGNYEGVSATPGFTTNTDGSYTGTISVAVPAKFMRAFGQTTIPVSARSTAVPRATATGGVCILLLEPTATALTVNSGVSISAPDCELDIRSTNTRAANFDSGGSAFNFKEVCVQGGANVNGGLTVNGLQKNCTPASDPFAGKLPSITIGSCISTQPVSGTKTLSPGTYCGGLNFNGTTIVHFTPGLFILKGGDWNAGSSTWDCPTCTGGAGVTFYFPDTSKIQFNSNVKLTLSAPTTGAYAGYLFFEAAGLSKTSWTFNAGPGWSLAGLMYLPSRNVTFNSSTNISSGNLTMVFNQLILDAGTKWTFTPTTTQTISPASSNSGTQSASSSVYLKN